MYPPLRSLIAPCCALLVLLCPAKAAVVINEIMFHPSGLPEVPAQEWVELYNASTTETVDLSGWKFSKGVSFTIPSGTVLAPGAFLVVAADTAVFLGEHPGFTAPLRGGWTGRLSNSGETVQLEDATGKKVDEASYSDDGEWAIRVRGALSFGHRGWDWESAADGGGKTLELRNPALASTGSGQAWGVSTPAGGTPGAVNSLASTDVAPLILDVKHRPQVPRSSDPITVSAEFTDDGGALAATTLFWRLDGGTWQNVPMSDTDGDGDREAIIPPQVNLAVIEFYLAASDGGNVRTWPAPAQTSNPGVQPATFGQATNALIQVDDSFIANADFTAAGAHPWYRLIMTEAERAELQLIGRDYAGKPTDEEQSEARMNATFISLDGTGVDTIYLAGVRNRGFRSALGPPNNYNVSFRHDDRWNDRSSLQLNAYYPQSQVLGNGVFHLAGVPPQETAAVRVLVNGVNLAESGARMYGRYARLEGRSGEWAERHFPKDSEGNFYRLDDHAYSQGDPRSGEFSWEGPSAAAYSDTFIKETNQDANDYSDLIEFARVVSAPITGGTAEQPAIANDAYVAAVAARLDIDQFYRFLAVDALIGNREGGLQTGRADDVSLYRGINDPRFKFIPHDLDDVFDLGAGLGQNPVTRSLFSYDGQAPTAGSSGLSGLTRMFNHPQLVPRYYTAVLDALDTWFNRATLDPFIDQTLGGWVPTGTIAATKSYVDARRANVLGQIQQNYALNVATSAADTAEGYKQTATGAATIGGTFNVARTYSVTVNGQLAQTFYRTVGTDVAGTWKLALPVGGGGVLRPGLNKLVVQFHDAPNGGGKVLQTLNADLFFTPTAISTVSGALTAAGSLAVMAPATYVPGVPVLVRLDLKDLAGNIDRNAWDRTANLSASNGITLNPSTITLTNGMGSALVTIGGGGGGGTTQLIAPGGTLQAPNASAPQWRMLDTGGEPAAAWKSALTFNDANWTLGVLQAGAGDGDERTVLNNVNTANTTRRAFYFRKVFNVANPGAFTGLQLRAVVDDGAVFYLNGQQVAVENMPAGTPTITTPASTNFSGTQETQLRTYNLTSFLNLLVAGDNLLAVEVHNFSGGGVNSADLSFDCQLEGTAAGTDPGSFSLTANIGGLASTKTLTSLGNTPVMTTVSGVLPGSTTWSGVINMTGDVTVPAGSTLTIEPGTHILATGTVGAGSSTGSDLIVNGAVEANGTLAQPISMTSSVPAARWGEINHTTATASTYNFCLITRATHSPGGGHTGTGPIVRLAGTTVTFNDCVLSDSPGKTIMNTGNCNITIRRTQMARGVMGPELDGSALLLEDSNLTDMFAIYRESGAQDDEDCLYIHDSGGRPVNILRTVIGKCEDDAVDALAGTFTIEDSIIRNALDKGTSMLNNDATFRRTLIIDNDIGISGKSRDASPRRITLENCTIVSEAHPLNTGDGEAHSVGVHARNKPGQGSPDAVILFNLKNCVVVAHEPFKHDAPYPPSNTTATFTCSLDDDTAGAPAWPGEGNLAADPLFVNAAGKDFHLTAGSPCRDAGDPASPLDPDGSRADMGAFPFSTGTSGGGEIRWSLAGSPYHVTANTTVPANLTLRIDPGVSIFFSQNARLTVNGRIIAEGTPTSRIVFSHVPGTNLTTDVDPIKLGTQTGAPKWGGIRIVDSMSRENVVKYVDFINAQGTSPTTSENYGSLGFIRSWGFCEGLTFSGTHLRMLYGRNSKLTVIRCLFPDNFIFDPVLGRIEEPTTDFIPSADNSMEPLKVEFPTTDPEVLGANAANFPNGLPINGHWRVYYNDFNGNRGHQDVFDADSGRWNQPGQFILDCRYNHFHGLTGDEHIDLGGDAYIASNIFERAMKDFWTNDTGYSNAISSGDKGTGTTIMVARNLCFDLDHVINLKASTATIFEHNTVANLHADFRFVGDTVTQNVICAPVNFFIAGDGPAPTNGDGAYLGFNLISNVPHLFSGADASASGPVTTKIEFRHNLLDQILDPAIGPNHPGGFFSGTYGPNEAGAPGFVNPAQKNYRLKPGSAALGTAPGGFDYGWSIPEWAYILGGPSPQTPATTATFTIGGPGLVAYRWRLNGGAWSPSIQIGTGGVFPRGTTPTIRQAVLTLTSLSNGLQTLEVIGQDMAGNWQDADPARTLIGAAQAAPTVRTWTVNTTLELIQINEVLAHSATAQPDTIELFNAGAGTVSLAGYTLTDDSSTPAKYVFPANISIPAGGYLTITSATSGLNLDKDGDAVYLYRSGTLVDSIVFGAQLPDLSIGRTGTAGTWALGVPSFGAANSSVRLGDARAVRINEWFTDGDVLYANDWIELGNPGSQPVDLAGLRITDNPEGDPDAHIFAPLTFIAGNGFLRLSADKDPKAGPTHLDFALDAQQENITLLDATGARLDAVFFYPQTTDRSMGRDAGGNLVFYELPTRGLANGTTDAGYANALAILRGLRITELMYNAIGGNDFDYVELRNVGPTSLQLEGVKFVTGIAFTFPAMILAPGQEVLVVSRLASFRSRYGSSPVVAGVYEGRLDNGGEEVAVQLPAPFDANFMMFGYKDGWYGATDGHGPSLVIGNPLAKAGDWNDRNTWQPSAVNGGNPGGVIAVINTYSGWSALYAAETVGDDRDADGVPALVEFGLGMSSENGNGPDGRAGLPTPGIGPNGRAQIALLLPADAGAVQGHGFADVRYQIQAADAVGTWTTIATKSFGSAWTGSATVNVGTASGGYLPVTVTDSALPTNANRFLRLLVTWLP